VILATQEAEIRRIMVWSQFMRPYLEKPITGTPSLEPPPTLRAVFSRFILFYLSKLSHFT
jgi:hypothetical protein